jgi:hypothetical protein
MSFSTDSLPTRTRTYPHCPVLFPQKHVFIYLVRKYRICWMIQCVFLCFHSPCSYFLTEFLDPPVWTPPPSTTPPLFILIFILIIILAFFLLPVFGYYRDPASHPASCILVIHPTTLHYLHCRLSLILLDLNIFFLNFSRCFLTFCILVLLRLLPPCLPFLCSERSSFRCFLPSAPFPHHRLLPTSFPLDHIDYSVGPLRIKIIKKRERNARESETCTTFFGSLEFDREEANQ